jgi:hypothetical protein
MFSLGLYKIMIVRQMRMIICVAMEMIGPIGEKLPKFIKACKGGRNESFMFGYDSETL